MKKAKPQNPRSLQAQMIMLCDLRANVTPSVGISKVREGYQVSSGALSCTDHSLEAAVNDLLTLVLTLYLKST